MDMITAQVTEQVIDRAALEAAVQSNEAGAMVVFSGDVRNHDGGKSVASLSYEIHPSAAEVIAELSAKVAAKHDVLHIAAVHRYGPIPIGESAFTVVVSAKHRGPAFAACMELVDTVKAELPIWKYQVFTDGTDEWVDSA